MPLIFEYEDVTKRGHKKPLISHQKIDDILDYFCALSNQQKIFFLWRPFLIDPKDDFILELATKSRADFIVTYNKKDFKNIDMFGVEVLTPKEFLQLLGEL